MSALEQNSPPKPESDCGLTRMCVNPVTPVHHDHQAPLWAVELVIFVLAVLVALVAYRLMLVRRWH
jgi:hypothetical protein